MTPIQTEIWQFIQTLNRLWTKDGKADELKNFFHKDMVAFVPTDAKRISGGTACVAGWKSFADAAQIHSWTEHDPQIQTFGNDQFAVVTYYFDISFTIHGQKIDMHGRDLFSLVKENGKWLIVADQYSPVPNS